MLKMVFTFLLDGIYSTWFQNVVLIGFSKEEGTDGCSYKCICKASMNGTVTAQSKQGRGLQTMVMVT